MEFLILCRLAEAFWSETFRRLQDMELELYLGLAETKLRLRQLPR